MLVIVLAHAGAQDCFDRHLPFWRGHGSDILVFCPEDAPVKTSLQTVLIGRAQHAGPTAGERFRKIWEAALNLNYDRYLYFEGDALSLDSRVPAFAQNETGFFGNEFSNNDPRFQGKRFHHPPYFCDRQSLWHYVKARREFPDGFEEGFSDRQISLVCDRAGIPFHGWSAAGFSRNTIEPGGPTMMAQAAHAAREGSTMYHGVKHQAVLETLVAAHRQHAARPSKGMAA
jgi:hypothetical protein